MKNAVWLENSFYGPTLSVCDRVDSDGERINEGPWNPLDDDGDCARLESICDINIVRQTESVTAVAPNGWPGITEKYEDHGGDKNAARRMAGTRAAAEIGRAM